MSVSAVTFIPNHYPVQYESTFAQALQQQQSLLRGAVTEKSASGERLRLNNLGAATSTTITTRAGATVAQDLTSEMVSIFPTRKQVTHRFDEFDEAFLGQIVMPNSDVAKAQAMALARDIDDIIVAAFSGSRWTGSNGTTEDTTFSSTQQIAVNYEDGSTNTGLSFEKIAAAMAQLDGDEVPQNGRYLGIKGRQMQDLVNDILANHSTDLASIKMMPGSRVITEILGFSVVQTERFTVNGSDIASCFAWQKDEVVLAVWNDFKSYMDILPDYSHALQVRSTLNIGASRRRNEGVIEILCDQSP